MIKPRPGDSKAVLALLDAINSTPVGHPDRQGMVRALEVLRHSGSVPPTTCKECEEPAVLPLGEDWLCQAHWREEVLAQAYGLGTLSLAIRASIAVLRPENGAGGPRGLWEAVQDLEDAERRVFSAKGWLMGEVSDVVDDDENR